MITAVVQFKLSEGTSLEEARSIFQTTAPRYRELPGLARKYYLFDEQTGVGGGCYLFEDREKADAIFNDEWRALIKEKYGADPDVRFFESPVIVDNVQGEIIGGAGE